MRELYTYGEASIRDGEVSLNGAVHFKSKGTSFEGFLSDAYEANGQPYPKFFKMDLLGKLGFIASELLLTHLSWIKELPKEKVSICLQTAHSSLDMDIRYQHTIEDKSEYFPSPGLFVYTLPNIAMGEMCIRNGFKGENICLISEQFDPGSVMVHVSDWLESESAEVCLVCWLDVLENKYSARVVAVGMDKQKSISIFDPEPANG